MNFVTLTCHLPALKYAVLIFVSLLDTVLDSRKPLKVGLCIFLCQEQTRAPRLLSTRAFPGPSLLQIVLPLDGMHLLFQIPSHVGRCHALIV